MGPSQNHLPGGIPFFDKDRAWQLCFAGLALRVAVFLFILFSFGDQGFILGPFSDGYGYTALAHNLIDGNGFSRETSAPFTADIKRVPLYPAFLAVTFAFTGGALWLASLLQCMLGAAVVYLLYRATESLAGRTAAFFAGALAAIYPFSVFLSTQILADTFFTLVLTGALVLFVRALLHPTHKHFLAGGVLMGIAALSKPAAQYIPFLLFPFALFAERGMRRFIFPAVFIACFFLVISPWVLRNRYYSGHATLSFEANILFDLHLAGYAALKETGEAGRAAEYRTTTSEESVLSASRSDYIKRLIAVGTTDPIGFATYLLLSTVPFVFGDGLVTMVTALSHDSSMPAWNFSTSASALSRTIGFGVLPPGLVMVSLVIKVLWAITLLGATVGFVRLMVSGRTNMLIALSLSLVVAYFMFAGGPVQSARYRLPVDPVIYLFAGVGISYLVQRFAIPARKQPALSPETN